MMALTFITVNFDSLHWRNHRDDRPTCFIRHTELHHRDVKVHV
jgi:hypothetical protein